MTHAEIRHILKDAFLSGPGARVLEVLGEMALADSADFCPDERRSQWLQGRRSLVLDVRNMIKEKEEDDEH